MRRPGHSERDSARLDDVNWPTISGAAAVPRQEVAALVSALRRRGVNVTSQTARAALADVRALGGAS